MQKGETLLEKRHPASGEVREQLERLLGLWQELLAALRRRGRGLEEAQDMLDFESQVDKVEAWIRDKVRRFVLWSTGGFAILASSRASRSVCFRLRKAV